VQTKLAFENSSVKQSEQVASVVELPAFATCWPATQALCLLQDDLPSEAWNSATPHVVQFRAFIVPEYLPDRQGSQRSPTLLELLESYLPGVHGSLT
jgi:hypothetical protein